MQPRRPHGHRAAALLDHHVADLAGGAAADPALAVEDQPAADPGAPEDAEDRVVRLAGAELELGVGGDVDVVGDPHLARRARPASVVAEREAPLPAGQVAGLGDVAGLLVGVAGRADPDPGERVGLHPGRVGGLDHRLPSPRRRPRAALGRRRAAGLAPDLALRGDDRGLDLRPAEVDAPAIDAVIGSLHGASLFRAASAQGARAQRPAKSASEWAMIAATIVSSTEGTRTSATTSWIFGAARAARSSSRRRASRRSAVACRWSCSASGEP